eukprot:TRINITY_DN1490_c5_g1_i1.p1 TRINITY_DN1490_c5_g1~~TRINITY_DN1490_c5_g1_i1.p1  ORF type:complete len:418 (+),score=156.44 TRINITY_DN1490_c5_g1_i1:61-1314(+)
MSNKNSFYYHYQLIISQLINHGYNNAAKVVSEATCTQIPALNAFPENHLINLVEKALTFEVEEETKIYNQEIMEDTNNGKINCLDFESELTRPSTNYVAFTTKYIANHKDACCVAKFNPEGNFIATGSKDNTIKLLSVHTMKNLNQKNELSEIENPQKPVLATYYTHTHKVNDLDFHPNKLFLISASSDNIVGIKDINPPINKKPPKLIKDNYPINSINYHPFDDFIIAGTDHPLIRLYDVEKGEIYVNKDFNNHHTAAINQVRYSCDGRNFVSCSKDGSIRVWDGINNNCILVIPSAHNGFEVNSVQISKNGKYILSGGRDSSVRLWDFSTGRQIRAFYGSMQMKNRIFTTFSHNEDLIYSANETNNLCLIWDSRTGEEKQQLKGHTNVVTWIGSSPIEQALVTCSNDHRARFWCI